MSNLKRDKSKLREDEEATAHVFQEFLQSFQIAPLPKAKTFVRSGILHPNSSKEEDVEKAKIYQPQPLLKQEKTVAVKVAIECARLVKETKTKEKRMSNLDALKEELKMRHSVKDAAKNEVNKGTIAEEGANLSSSDPKTTNLFVANLSPSVTENDLMVLFGAYGPLASVKIMWPRGDDRPFRNTNCGFVAFMSRKDGERALDDLQHRDDMRVGWAKLVEIPSHPVYVPPELMKMYLPPPPSGLPFNAQPLNKSFKEPTCEEEMNELLRNSVVKVVVPLNKITLMTVHRMVEFVAREGPLFEAFIMNREIDNPLYQFLFDYRSPVHIYYRWKLYSILHGESTKKWLMEKFRMFKGGSIWQPPAPIDYTKGMPDELIPASSLKTAEANNRLSDTQCSRLVHHIQNTAMQRATVAESMIFCMSHQAAAKDIAEIITDSLRNAKTNPTKKVARLYLISDILYNATHSRPQKVNAQFQMEFQERLPQIFASLAETLKRLQRQADKDEYKRRVLKVLQSWKLWAIYEKNYLDKLKSTFCPESLISDNDDSDTEGPLDGESIIKRSLKNKIDENVSIAQSPCFVPSKWETVDPEEVEAQAMSTKKLYALECQRKLEETVSKILSENERKRLRQIEVKVLQLQEELETQNRLPRKGYSIQDEINSYREHLKRKLKTSDDSAVEDRKKSKKESRSSRSKSSKKSRR